MCVGETLYNCSSLLGKSRPHSFSLPFSQGLPKSEGKNNIRRGQATKKKKEKERILKKWEKIYK